MLWYHRPINSLSDVSFPFIKRNILQEGKISFLMKPNVHIAAKKKKKRSTLYYFKKVFIPPFPKRKEFAMAYKTDLNESQSKISKREMIRKMK